MTVFCDPLKASLVRANTTRRRLFDALLHEVLASNEDQEEAA